MASPQEKDAHKSFKTTIQSAEQDLRQTIRDLAKDKSPKKAFEMRLRLLEATQSQWHISSPAAGKKQEDGSYIYNLCVDGSFYLIDGDFLNEDGRFILEDLGGKYLLNSDIFITQISFEVKEAEVENNEVGQEVFVYDEFHKGSSSLC